MWIVPGDERYESARPLWNARFDDVRPAAIAPCGSTADVAAALGRAVREGLPVTARSGGHDFAGGSTGPGLVIDVGQMNGVEVTGGVVRIGAGAQLGEVYPALDPDRLALPAGTCPEVGIAGLTLGGGLGPLGRGHGVLADRLRGAEVVLADGRAVACDEHRHEDLFWALRGAGALGFGVVTELTFAPVPAPERAVDIHLTWPAAAMAGLIAAWQGWAPFAPDPLAASLKLTVPAEARDEPHVDVYATFFGSRGEAERLLAGLLERAPSPPANVSVEESSYPESRAFWSSLGQPEDAAAPAPRERVFVKSRFFHDPLAAPTVDALLAATLDGRIEGESRELDFMPWGGAYVRRRPDEMAFVHRDAAFLLKVSTALPADRTPATDALARVGRMSEATRAAGAGSFQNFADPDLDPWSPDYHGANLPRLREVKARYDPNGVFAPGEDRGARQEA